MKLIATIFTGVLLLTGCPSLAPRVEPAPAHGILGIDADQLAATYWQRKLGRDTSIILSAKAIAQQNALLRERDPSLHSLDALTDADGNQQISASLTRLATRPSQVLFDVNGNELTGRQIDVLIENLNLARYSSAQPLRWGLITRRADLRRLPTSQRAFSVRGDTDIDRFQESAIFPGTAVAIGHESQDGQWLYVISEHYAAWVEKQFVAETDRRAVLAYRDSASFLVVTGAKAFTVFSREQPAVSELQLDMGVRVPLLTQWPVDDAVNGQLPSAHHVISLPVRGQNGQLQLLPALVPRSADVNHAYLPLNRINIISQAFKFFGERYGWGHAYNARDCSGFIGEVYRSFGIVMPRNTKDQSISNAFNRIDFSKADSREDRMRAVAKSQVGDLIYIPGHVMMIVGFEHGQPYVIHDTAGASFRHGKDLIRLPLNGVSLTPFLPLMITTDDSYLDRMTSIVRMRP